MEIKELKELLHQKPEKIQLILEDLGCHHVQFHTGSPDDYFTCANYQGDNNSAITIYLNPSLLTINYTRNISLNKQTADFLDLVQYYKDDKTLFENIKYICELAEIDYYYNFKQSLPKSLQILRDIKKLLDNSTSHSDEEDIPIKIRNPKILDYYFPYGNQVFEDDGIDLATQREFGVGYDPQTERITIPIYDEIGNLIGVKGRYFYRDVPEGVLKYYSIEKYPRHRILYGYNFTKDFIKEKKEVLVHEAEKATLQTWSYGYKNSVSTMGMRVSQGQIDKLNRLGVDIILCFDQGVKWEELVSIAEKFNYGINVYALVDDDKILPEKFSPSDRKDLFEYMYKNNKIKLR